MRRNQLRRQQAGAVATYRLRSRLVNPTSVISSSTYSLRSKEREEKNDNVSARNLARRGQRTSCNGDELDETRLDGSHKLRGEAQRSVAASMQQSLALGVRALAKSYPLSADGQRRRRQRRRSRRRRASERRGQRAPADHREHDIHSATGRISTLSQGRGWRRNLTVHRCKMRHISAPALHDSVANLRRQRKKPKTHNTKLKTEW